MRRRKKRESRDVSSVVVTRDREGGDTRAKHVLRSGRLAVPGVRGRGGCAAQWVLTICAFLFLLLATLPAASCQATGACAVRRPPPLESTFVSYLPSPRLLHPSSSRVAVVVRRCRSAIHVCVPVFTLRVELNFECERRRVRGCRARPRLCDDERVYVSDCVVSSRSSPHPT